MSSSNYCFLTCIQISQEAGQVVWYSHLFQNFSQFVVIHTIKDFGIGNKAEVNVFLELSCFLMIQRMLAIWSLVPLPFLNPAWTSGSSWFMYCWSLAWLIYWVLWLDRSNETLTPTHAISGIIPVRALQPGNWRSQQSSMMVTFHGDPEMLPLLLSDPPSCWLHSLQADCTLVFDSW